MQERKVLEELAEKAVKEHIAPSLEQECAATVIFYEVTDQAMAKLGLKTPCGNCPRAHATILQSVSVAVRTMVPGIKGVEPFFL